MKVLAVDIGNTSITLGLVDDGRVLKTEATATGVAPRKLKLNLLKSLEIVLGEHRLNLESVIVCSVVPDVVHQIEIILTRELKKKIFVVGRDILVPIINRYREPRQVGQDRLVCAYAAMKLYGAPAIVVDSGTAITFDVISKRKEYLGGLIVPGIRLSTDVLFQKTALLPQVEVHQPRTLIGKNTEESILSGIFYGYGEMIQGLIRLLSKRVKVTPYLILTGGYLDIIEKYVFVKKKKKKYVIEKELIMKGMYLLVQENIS